MVAQIFAEEEEDDEHDEQTLMSREISTSRTLARMVVVRSTATFIWIVGRDFGLAAAAFLSGPRPLNR